MMQRVDVFDPALTNEEQNEHTLFSFSDLLLIMSIVTVLSPVIPPNI
jgi:hypothetical protein